MATAKKKTTAKKSTAKKAPAKKAVAVVAEKANTKARQVRELIRGSRTKDIDKLIAKVNESNIGIPEANVRRYVVGNLAKVNAEKSKKAA